MLRLNNEATFEAGLDEFTMGSDETGALLEVSGHLRVCGH